MPVLPGSCAVPGVGPPGGACSPHVTGPGCSAGLKDDQKPECLHDKSERYSIQNAYNFWSPFPEVNNDKCTKMGGGGWEREAVGGSKVS